MKNKWRLEVDAVNPLNREEFVFAFPNPLFKIEVVEDCDSISAKDIELKFEADDNDSTESIPHIWRMTNPFPYTAPKVQWKNISEVTSDK